MKKLILFLLLFIFISPSVIAAIYVVNSEKQFEEIIPKLVAGDEVRIKNGIYTDWSIALTANGTARAPITIRPENEGKVTFSGDVSEILFKLSGSYLILKGIHFKNCTLLKSAALVVLTNAENCLITRCSFTTNTAKAQFTPLVVVSGKGMANQITNCRFIANVDNQDVQVKITKESRPLNTLI